MSNEYHENLLLKELAATDAVVWSPQTDRQTVQALSQLLVSAQDASNV